VQASYTGTSAALPAGVSFGMIMFHFFWGSGLAF